MWLLSFVKLRPEPIPGPAKSSCLLTILSMLPSPMDYAKPDDHQTVNQLRPTPFMSPRGSEYRILVAYSR